MIEKQKIKAIAAKCQSARREISLYIKKEQNCENNIRDKINSYNVNDEYLLSFWKVMRKKTTISGYKSNLFIYYLF